MISAKQSSKAPTWNRRFHPQIKPNIPPAIMQAPAINGYMALAKAISETDAPSSLINDAVATDSPELSPIVPTCAISKITKLNHFAIPVFALLASGANFDVLSINTYPSYFTLLFTLLFSLIRKYSCSLFSPSNLCYVGIIQT